MALEINGSQDDVDAFRKMLQNCLDSPTFRNLLNDIESDPSQTVTINLVRDTADWLDTFDTNDLDLSDLEGVML